MGEKLVGFFVTLVVSVGLVAAPTPTPVAAEAPTPTPTMAVVGPVLGPCGRGPVGSSTFDDINVGNYSPCATVDVAKVIAILATPDALPYGAINQFDRLFEADTRYGYQYRQGIPARITAAAPAARLMWGSLSWAAPIDESRIVRLRCDGQVCIYLIADGDDFQVGWPGRGLLLSRPLNPEVDLTDWWGK